VLLATANKAPDPDFTEEEEKTLAAVRKPQKQEGSRWKDSTSCQQNVLVIDSENNRYKEANVSERRTCKRRHRR
jgi:hypothetical protein